MSRNLPNQITVGRLLAAIVFFILLTQYNAADAQPANGLLHLSFWLFLAAALSDVVDGYLARKYKLESSFGRIFDPFVDKILVCGAFVFFASGRFVVDDENVTGVSAWMVVLIFSRELLVTGLRNVSEAQGKAFGANVIGKLKMTLQSVAAGWILITVALPQVFAHPMWSVGRAIVLYLAVGVTALSILVYVHRARGVLRGPMGA